MIDTHKSPLQRISLDDAPLRFFHLRLTIAGTGGQINDGFILGIIGIAASLAKGPLHLTSLWLGLLGAASLAGLFVGALITGPIADRIGRRHIFAWNMLAFTILSVLQFFVTSAWQLLILRLLLGLILGADYVVGKTLITEYIPRRIRGRLLSVLAVAWATGYVASYLVGYWLHAIGPDSWRWILLSGAVISALVLVLRQGIPESPRWLVNHGRHGEAQDAIDRKLGRDIRAPEPTDSLESPHVKYRELFNRGYWRNTMVGMVFYTCQVIPFFALGTFLPQILQALHVQDNYLGSTVYNLFLLSGAIIGLLIVDRLARRVFLIGTFYLFSVPLAIMTFWTSMPPTAAVIVFGVFALILAAAVNFDYVYPPELFPTRLRATGVAAAVAASRLGSAGSTFLLPIVVSRFGVHAALGACLVVALIGGVVCHIWAPETRNKNIDSDDSRAMANAPT